MAFLIPSVLFIFVIKIVVCLNAVDQACLDSHQNELNNDFLIGTWYHIYKFALWLNLPPTTQCTEVIIAKPNATHLQNYVDAYPLENPFSFEDNPVVMDSNSEMMQGMVMGLKEAKFFVYDPKNYYYKPDRFQVTVYKKVNDDYILMHECSLRGFTRWLMSKNRNPSDEELKNVLDSIKDEIGTLQTQKFCSLT